MAAKQKDQLNIPALSADFSSPLQTEAHEVPYPPRRCFNLYSAAQYCACKTAAIEQAIHDGNLKAIRIGRGYVITRESLDKYIDEREAVEPHVPPSILARRAARIANASHIPAPKPARKARRTHKSLTLTETRSSVGSAEQYFRPIVMSLGVL